MSIFSRLFQSSKAFDFKGLTDWHSHILPGVDDGVENIEDSLSILAEYERMGIESVWLTPHIMEDVPNSPRALKARFAQLSERYDGPVKLHLAAENMIDRLFIDRLESGDLLPIGSKGNMLLVETSYFNAPYNLNKTFEKIKSKGFHPLLAHPERYNYMESISEYEQLKKLGVLFQLNMLSLTGFYGKIAKDKAHRLLKMGMYDAVGSDIHRPEQLSEMNKLKLPADKTESLRAAFKHI